MKTEKIIKLRVELDETERMALNEAITVLEKIKEAMEKHDCDTLMCCDEYTYDISDVRSMIDDLEKFEDISEIIY